MSAGSTSRGRLALIAIGLLLIPLFVAHIGVGAIAAELARLGPEALLVPLPYAAGTALGGLSWCWLLKGRVRLQASAAIASRFAASGANALLPFVGVAGEPCRLLWLPRSARMDGLAAIVIDRLLYNWAGALPLLAGAAAAVTTHLPGAVSAATAGLGATMALSTSMLFIAVSRWGMGQPLHRLIRRFVPAPYGALGGELDAALRGFCERPRRYLLRALAVHCVARLLLAIEVFVALWSLDAPTSFADAVVLATVPVVMSIVAASIPSQIGVQEGAQALVSSALGLDPALGFSLVLLSRLRQLIFVPLTPLLLASARARQAEGVIPASAR